MGLRDKRYLRYGCNNEVAFAASGEAQCGGSDVTMFNQSSFNNTVCGALFTGHNTYYRGTIVIQPEVTTETRESLLQYLYNMNL